MAPISCTALRHCASGVIAEGDGWVVHHIKIGISLEVGPHLPWQIEVPSSSYNKLHGIWFSGLWSFREKWESIYHTSWAYINISIPRMGGWPSHKYGYLIHFLIMAHRTNPPPKKNFARRWLTIGTNKTVQPTKTETLYPTESNRGYHFKIRVGIKHHGTKKKTWKNTITPTRSNKIRLKPKAMFLYGYVGALAFALHASSSEIRNSYTQVNSSYLCRCFSPWFTRWITILLGKMMMKHQMFVFFPTIFIYETYQSSVALSNEHLNVPLWVKDQFRSNLPLKFITFFAQLIVHHALAFLHQPHTIGIFGYLGNSQVSSQWYFKSVFVPWGIHHHTKPACH